jgi:hypothetical protein
MVLHLRRLRFEFARMDKPGFPSRELTRVQEWTLPCEWRFPFERAIERSALAANNSSVRPGLWLGASRRLPADLAGRGNPGMSQQGSGPSCPALANRGPPEAPGPSGAGPWAACSSLSALRQLVARRILRACEPGGMQRAPVRASSVTLAMVPTY